jgi:hypothetical protein
MRYVLLITFFILNLSAKAQSLPEFAPHGADWTYINPTSYPGIFNMIILPNDTIVNGKLCRQFHTLGNPTMSASIDTFFAYRDSLKIYTYSKYTGNRWRIQYDFAWITGQKVYVPIFWTSWTGIDADSALFTIKQKGDTTINTIHLPYLILDTIGLVIMNIGPLNRYFIPSVFSSALGDVTNIRCYRGQDLGAYKASGVADCDTTTSVENLNKNKVIVYPNPAYDNIMIESDVSFIRILLYDMYGTKLYEGNTNSLKTELNLQAYPPGDYILQLSTEDWVVNKKLVKY